MLHERSTELNVTRRKVMWLGAAIGCGVSLALLLLAALGGAGEPPALAAPLASPALLGVSPAQAYNDQATVITITGSGFTATPIVYLNQGWLEDVSYLDAATLTATVPADWPGGAYTLTVTNPGGQSASLANAFTVDRAGDGELGAWQTTTSWRRIAFFTAVAARDSVYAIDGWFGGVDRAIVNPDGTLGAWQGMPMLTSSRVRLGAAIGKSYIYAVGGYRDGSTCLDTVERAPILADGTLGAWLPLTATFNIDRGGFGVFATDDFIYTVGGLNPDQPVDTNTVERAAINADGTLGAWQILTSTLNTARDGHVVVRAGSNVFAIGGHHAGDSEDLTSIEQAVVNPDGTLSPWRILTSQLAAPRSGFAGVEAGGYVYVIGGQRVIAGIAVYLNTAERAVVNADGTLGAWEALAPTLATGRSWLAAVYGGHSIYVLGGENNLGAMDSVERAAVSAPSLFSFDPSLVPSTQSTDVTVWGNNLRRPVALHLPDGTPLTTTVGTPYTFTATIPAGLAAGWYAATVTLHNNASATQSNLFVVQAPPPRLARTVYLPLAVHQSALGCGHYLDDFGWRWTGWYIGNDGWVLADYVNGEYRVLSEYPGYLWFFYPPTCLRQNYIVEADARWVADSGGDYGLIFGRNATGQYYLFRVSPYWGDYRLVRRDPGAWVNLQPWTVNAAVHTGGASNHLKVTRNGAQISLELNGTFLGTWTDATTSGPTRVGVYSTRNEDDPVYSDARFDNFRITTLPGETSPGVRLQSEPATLGEGQGAAPTSEHDPAPPRRASGP